MAQFKKRDKLAALKARIAREKNNPKTYEVQRERGIVSGSAFNGKRR